MPAVAGRQQFNVRIVAHFIPLENVEGDKGVVLGLNQQHRYAHAIQEPDGGLVR